MGHDTSNFSNYRTETVSMGGSIVGFDPKTHFGGGLSVNVGWDRQSNSTMLTTGAYGAYGDPKTYGKLGASTSFDVSGLSNYDDWKYASHSFDLGGEVRFKIGKSGLYQSLSGGISYSKDRSNEDLWSVYLTSNTTKAGGFMGDSGSNTLGISLYANDNGEFNSSSYAMFTSYDENWYTSEEQAAQNFTNALTQGLVDAGDLNENAILNAYNENKLTAEQALFLIDQRDQANGYPAAPPFSNPNLLADPTTMGRREDEFGNMIADDAIPPDAQNVGMANNTNADSMLKSWLGSHSGDSADNAQMLNDLMMYNNITATSYEDLVTALSSLIASGQGVNFPPEAKWTGESQNMYEDWRDTVHANQAGMTLEEYRAAGQYFDAMVSGASGNLTNADYINAVNTPFENEQDLQQTGTATTQRTQTFDYMSITTGATWGAGPIASLITACNEYTCATKVSAGFQFGMGGGSAIIMA